MKTFKKIGIGLGAVFAVFVIVAVAVTLAGHSAKTTNSTSGFTPVVYDQNGKSCTALGGNGYCPGDGPVPTPTPSVVPPNKIEFVVSGYAPGDPACGSGCDPDISYGSNNDTNNLSEAVNGTLTFSMPFDPNAEFYDISVNTTTSDSHLTCKIVVTGPSPDAPLVADSASETGSGICDAQAAPSNSGESWLGE